MATTYSIQLTARIAGPRFADPTTVVDGVFSGITNFEKFVIASKFRKWKAAVPKSVASDGYRQLLKGGTICQLLKQASIQLELRLFFRTVYRYIRPNDVTRG